MHRPLCIAQSLIRSELLLPADPETPGPDVRTLGTPGDDLNHFWRQQRKATAIFIEALHISKKRKNSLASINTLNRQRGKWENLGHDKQTECYYMLRSLFGKRRSDNEVSQCIKPEVKEISAAALRGGEWSGENAIQQIEKAVERAFAAYSRTNVELATNSTQTQDWSDDDHLPDANLSARSTQSPYQAYQTSAPKSNESPLSSAISPAPTFVLDNIAYRLKNPEADLSSIPPISEAETMFLLHSLRQSQDTPSPEDGRLF